MSPQPLKSEAPFQLRMIRLDPAPSVVPRWWRRGLLAMALIAVALLVLLGPLLARLWLPAIVSGNGWLEPAISREVRAPFEGRLIAVLVATGDSVEQGQPVAMLDQQEIREQIVEVGDELRVLHLQDRRAQRDREIELTEVGLERRAAELDLADARDNLLRRSFEFLGRTVDIDSLLERHLPGSHIGVDAAVNGVHRVQTRLEQIAMRDLRLRDPADSLQAAARLTQLEHRRDNLLFREEAALLRAPIGGVVQTSDLDRMVDRRVSAGEGVIEIAAHNAWRVRLLVSGSGIHRVHPGDSVRVKVESLGEILPDPLNANVEEVGIRPATGEGSREEYFVLAGLLPPSDGAAARALRSGLVVRGDIITERTTLASVLETWWRRTMAAVQ